MRYRTKTMKHTAHSEPIRLEPIRQFIERYKAFADDRTKEAEKRASSLKVALASFWPQFNEARSDYKKNNRVEAQGFNLLEVLNIEDQEDTHSRILANLLDPQETHGQGALFLERFLDRIKLGHLKAELTAPGAYVTVRYNGSVSQESNRRPDIFLQCGRSFAVMIENKVKAKEAYLLPGKKWQLQVYRELLNKVAADEKRLIFLTVDGKDSRSGEEDQCLYYFRDIREWIEECLDKVDAPTVQDMLRRYLRTLENLRSL